MLYTRSFYWLAAPFTRSLGSRHFVPAIGAFLSGLLGLLYYAFGQDKAVFGRVVFWLWLTAGCHDNSGRRQHVIYGCGPVGQYLAFGKILTTV